MSSYLSLIPINKNSLTGSIISSKQLKYLNNFSMSPKNQGRNTNIISFVKSKNNNSFQKLSLEKKGISFQQNYINPYKPELPKIRINYIPIRKVSGNNMMNSVSSSYNKNSSFLSSIKNINYIPRKKISKFNLFNKNKKLKRHNIVKGNNKNKFCELLTKNQENNELNYCSSLSGKDFVNNLNFDSLNIIQENLQNKLYEMGMGSDFIGLETSPLEISISKLKNRKKRIIPSQIISNCNKDNSYKNIKNETHTISQVNKNSKYNSHNTSSNKSKNSESFLLNEEDVKSTDKHILPTYNNTTNEDNKKGVNIKNSVENLIKELKVEKNQNSKNKLCEYKFRNFEHKKLIYDSLDDEEIIENVIEKTFYISPDNKYIFVFDSLVFLSSLYIFIINPIDMILYRCNNSYWKIIINTSIDILFIIDLILSFYRAYYNSEGQLIIKSNEILENYLTSYFAADIISTIPFYSIFHFYTDNYNICTKNFITINEQYYKIFNLLKISKFIKCYDKNKNTFIKYCLLNLNEFYFFEKWSFLIGCVSIFILILHITACIHIFISTVSYPNWITQQNLQDASFIKIYICSIYFLIVTVTSVGYGDITGNSFIEIIFQIFLLIVGIISYSWLISFLSNYIKEKNKLNEIFYNKVNILKEIKHEYPKMPKKLYDRIFLHLKYTNLIQKNNTNFLMDSLPYSIQRSLLFEMYKPIIENFHFFKNFHNSEFLKRVISKLTPSLAHKNDILIEQGEIIENTIFVKQGKLSIEVKIDEDNPEGSIEKLLNEEYFLSVENNNIIQSKSLSLNDNIFHTNITNGNSFSLLNLSTMHNKSLLNPKNIYDLYSGKDKINLKHNISTEEIKAHPNLNIKYIHLKILDIRKNEHFGALLMFLNQRSPISLRVKTKKAELYILKKIDAVEISSCYPNIWKRVNKKSFHNLKQIKIKMKEIITHFCDSYGIYKFLNFKTNNLKNTIINKSLVKPKSTILNLNKPGFNMTFGMQQSKTLKKLYSKVTTLPENEELIMKNTLKRYSTSPKNNITSKIQNFKQTLSINTKKSISNKANDVTAKNISQIYNFSDISNISASKTNKITNYLQKNRPFYIRRFGDDNYLYNINNIDLKTNFNNNNSILVNSIEDLSRTIKIEDDEPKLILNRIKNNINKINVRIPLIQLNNENKDEEMNKNFGTSYFSEEINDDLYYNENFKLNNFENKEKYYNNVDYILENNNFENKEKLLLSNSVCLPVDTYKNKNNISSSLSTIQLQNKILNINILKRDKNILKNNTFNNKNQQNELCFSHLSLNYLKNNKNNIKNIKEKSNNNKIEFSIFKTSLELLSESKAFDNVADVESNINNKNEKNKSRFMYMKKSNTALGVCKSSSDHSSYSENEDEKNNSKNISRSKSSNKNSKHELKMIVNRSKTVKNSNTKNNIKYKSNEFINSKQCEKTSCNDQLLFNDISNISVSNNYNDDNKLKLSKVCFSMKIKSAYKNLNKLSNYQYIKDKDYQKIIKRLIKKKYKKINKFKESSIRNNAKKFSTYSNNFVLNDNLSSFKRNTTKRFHKEKSIKENNNINDDNRKLSINKNINIPKQRPSSSKNKNNEIILANKNLKMDTAVLRNPEKFYSGFFNDLMKKRLQSFKK